MTVAYLTLGDPESSKSRSLRIHKRTELGHMLLLNVTMNPYMESLMTLSYFTLSDVERSKSRSLKFLSIISVKRAELGHMLLLNINMKAYTRSPLMQLHLTSETLKGQCQGHSDCESLKDLS